MHRHSAGRLQITDARTLIVRSPTDGSGKWEIRCATNYPMCAQARMVISYRVKRPASLLVGQPRDNMLVIVIAVIIKPFQMEFANDQE
jgi:hypothetical protein